MTPPGLIKFMMTFKHIKFKWTSCNLLAQQQLIYNNNGNATIEERIDNM